MKSNGFYTLAKKDCQKLMKPKFLIVLSKPTFHTSVFHFCFLNYFVSYDYSFMIVPSSHHKSKYIVSLPSRTCLVRWGLLLNQCLLSFWIVINTLHSIFLVWILFENNFQGTCSSITFKAKSFNSFKNFKTVASF